MAVAVKNTPDVSSSSLLDRLAIVSLLGTAYVLGCIGIVFYLLPSLWWMGWDRANFVAMVFLGLVMLVVAAGLAVLGVRLLGPRSVPGVRAGIFWGVVGFVIVLLLTRWTGMGLENAVYQYDMFGDNGPVVGAILTGVAGLVLLAVVVRLFLRPRFEKWLVRFEAQGWFNARPYKPLQGLRVRRGTIFGILVLVGAGIYTMINHNTFSGEPRDWALNIPFTGKVIIRQVTLIKDSEVPIPARAMLAADFCAWVAQTPSAQSLATGPAPCLLSGAEWVVRSEKATQVVNDYSNDAAGVLDRRFPGWREQARPGHPFELDRFTLKQVNAEIDPARFVKIRRQGSASDKFKFGTIVPREEFNAELARLGEDRKKPEDRTFREQAPVPADGPKEYATLTLLPSLYITVPLLLLFGSLWLAWRIVNMPTFGDFLIATEAELNKVSWTTQRRLVQDTAVVLMTVVLMAGFLFLMDQAWRVMLSWPPIGVLKIPPDEKKPGNTENRPW
jgi:preprotein translocase SecE subunit